MLYRISIFFKSQKLKLMSIRTIILSELKHEKSFVKKIILILLIPFKIIKVLCGKEVIIPYVELVVTTFCNLKCQGCSALMEHYKNPKHIDLEDNIKSIKRLMDLGISIKSLRLLGGEPLCYPKLYELLEYLQKQDKINEVAIVTNGTMTLKDEKLINILKDNKFWFSISDYGEVSKNFNNLINQLKEYNIRYVPQSSSYEWVDYGNFEKRNRNEKEYILQYNKCTHRRNSLLNGKLFHCFRCSHATNLKFVSLIKKDYIDLFDENISNKKLKKQLYKFIYKYTPYIESCKYCDCGFNLNMLSRGKQNEKK